MVGMRERFNMGSETLSTAIEGKSDMVADGAPWWGAIIVLFCLVSVLPSPVGAQAGPWIGEWTADDCEAGGTRIILSKSQMDLSTFETMCDIRKVRKRGAIYRFDVTCQSEEYSRRGSFSVRIDGDTLVFVAQKGFQFSPKRFSRCGTGKIKH